MLACRLFVDLIAEKIKLLDLLELGCFQAFSIEKKHNWPESQRMELEHLN